MPHVASQCCGISVSFLRIPDLFAVLKGNQRDFFEDTMFVCGFEGKPKGQSPFCGLSVFRFERAESVGAS